MSEPFIAQITMFGGTFAPRGWAQCDGALLAIPSHTALFSILGTTYGGDGQSTFGLPDLRSRVPMHYGTGPGLTPRSLGQKGGNESTLLSTGNLPSHNHGLNNTSIKLKVNSGAADDGDESSPAGGFPGGETTDRFYEATNASGVGGALEGNTDSVGGNQSFSNLPPFQAINFLIALVGLFPSRN